MATKASGVPCYNKAAPDEPLFVLRAQDLLAPTAVNHWAALAEVAGVNPEKVAEARETAQRMIEWRGEGKSIRAKLPD